MHTTSTSTYPTTTTASSTTLGGVTNHTLQAAVTRAARFYGARKKLKYLLYKAALAPNSTKFLCPEEEKPSNIGPYEVPTQRDLVSLARATLRKMFRRYHKKATYFLEDIKKATRATAVMGNNCTNQAMYRGCVRGISGKCEGITKGYVATMEAIRQDVDAFSEQSICSLSSMKEDPVNLIKVLAMEEAALDFALPGFLRLLSSCSVYCERSTKIIKAVPHGAEDPAVKQFLSPRTYKKFTFISKKGKK